MHFDTAIWQRKRGIFLEKLWKKLKQDPVLLIAAALAVLSCFVVHPDRKYLEYFNTDTLMMLFCLMLIVAGLKQLHFFSWLGQAVLRRIHGQRGILLTLVFLCFFSSMFITNDVALITFVPFGISLLEMVGMTQAMCFTVVMMTISANLGSMFTPIGNPQNLYLYAVSGMNLGGFLLLMLPLTLLSAVCLFFAVSVFGVKKTSRDKRGEASAFRQKKESPILEENLGCSRKAGFWLILFFCSLLSVAGVISKWMLLIVVVIGVMFLDRSVFRRIDYGLLGTFCCFFIFIGNMNRMEALREILVQVLAGRECVVAVALSQIISNVPAAILLSGYTSDIRGLIVGTNLGGLGTLIASMASLISYKQIAVWNPQVRKTYLAVFTGWNVVMLAVLLAGAGVMGLLF